MSKYKDPEGGLTEAGRRKFEQSGESKNLKPGVKDSSPTGERARRKGSFFTLLMRRACSFLEIEK